MQGKHATGVSELVDECSEFASIASKLASDGSRLASVASDFASFVSGLHGLGSVVASLVCARTSNRQPTSMKGLTGADSAERSDAARV